jgi:hypothetical protein
MRKHSLIAEILVTLALTGCTKPGKQNDDEEGAPE